MLVIQTLYHKNQKNSRTKRCQIFLVESQDNYPNVITVLMYLRIDGGIKEGNIRYKDKNDVKYVLPLKSGTTVIMDGNVPHKPQDLYGSGKRDLINFSFEK